jgi:two-component system C4-dicarboxylate transport sensor histidine kinase DctB
LLLAFLALHESYRLAWSHSLKQLHDEARSTAQLRVLVLQSELEKQRAIPLILADDSDVILAVRQSNAASLHRISRKLEKLKNGAHSAVIYILNAEGIALSASNWALSTSFVGNNYSFREYFSQAMSKGYAEQFALGTVSRKPGLYLAQSVFWEGQPIGVVVVKVEFDDMEAAWAKTSDQTVVTDAQGNIVLTFDPDLRFQKVSTPTSESVTTQIPVPVDGWQLQLVSTLKPVKKAAQDALMMAIMVEILLGMSMVIWLRRQRRIQKRLQAETHYREQLELNVAARTNELSQTNERLSLEITERKQAEQKLNLLQADLVQANKLASLGQITAGVAHEINQPLATIRVLADTSLKLVKKPQFSPELVTENLNNIVRMSERIGHITGDLRTFSRKAMTETEAVSLKETIDSSVLLNKSRLRENKVKLIRDFIDPNLQVMAGRIRLEQVLVNLLQNAYEALENVANPSVRISFTQSYHHVILSITDNGNGIPSEVFDKLFTPFITTKLKGLGLGLVIAHDIIRDFGGELRAESSSEGAAFHIKLLKVIND